jgi:hypothetical protein
MVPSVQIDLSDYPEALQIMREKGWLQEAPTRLSQQL